MAADPAILTLDDPFVIEVLEGQSENILSKIYDVLPFDRYEFLNRTDGEHNSILHHLCNTENINAVTLNLLLEYGADPCLKNNLEQSPMFNACKKYQKEALDCMIQYGAKFDEKDVNKKNCCQMLEDVFKRKDIEKAMKKSHIKFVKNVESKLAVYPEAHVRAGYKAAFDTFDTEKNGSLNMQEMQNVLFSLMSEEPTIEESEEFFSWMDTNADSVVSWDEYFAAMMKNFHFEDKKKCKKKKGLKNKKKKFKKKRRKH